MILILIPSKCLHSHSLVDFKNVNEIIHVAATGGAVLVSDSAVVSDDVPPPGQAPLADVDDIMDDAVKCAHIEKDFISLLSSTPGQHNEDQHSAVHTAQNTSLKRNLCV